MQKYLTSYLTALILGLTLTHAKPHKKITEVSDPLHTSYPILSDMKYFPYKGLNANQITIKSLLAFSRSHINALYPQDPKKTFNFLCLMILVEKSLQGIAIEQMNFKDRQDLALSQVTIYLRKYGYYKLLNKYEGANHPSQVIPAEVICRMAEDVKESIFSERNHYKHIFEGM